MIDEFMRFYRENAVFKKSLQSLATYNSLKKTLFLKILRYAFGNKT